MFPSLPLILLAFAGTLALMFLAERVARRRGIPARPTRPLFPAFMIVCASAAIALKSTEWFGLLYPGAPWPPFSAFWRPLLVYVLTITTLHVSWQLWRRWSQSSSTPDARP